MNDTLIPSAFPNTLTFPLLKALLGQVNKPIVLQVLDHLAEVTDTGAAVAQPLAPVLVQLFAADDVHNDPAATEDFRALLAEIPAGSLLYRMYGRVNRKDKPVYVGSVFLESSFVASAFGDRILAFRHSLVSNPDSAPEV